MTLYYYVESDLIVEQNKAVALSSLTKWFAENETHVSTNGGSPEG